MPLVVPRLVLKAETLAWNLVSQVATPGRSGSGVLPITRVDGGGLWMAQSELLLHTSDQIRTWRALRMAADGGATAFVLSRFDYFPPYPVIGGETVTEYEPVPHSDDATFSDGSGYAQSAVVARTVGATALRATAMTLELISGEPLRGGECFSIYHEDMLWRMYEVKSVVIDGDGHSAITFRPPLREAVADGANVEFDLPRCMMQLAKPDAMDVTLLMAQMARQSAQFIEAFPPFDED